MSETAEAYTCRKCKTKMDLVLKPEGNGVCCYCNVKYYFRRREGLSGLNLRGVLSITGGRTI